MNKKGFTLAEILGVIVIISLLLLLIIPTIVDKISNTGDEAVEAENEIIYSAADQYISEHSEDYPSGKSGRYCIPIQTLIDAGILVEPVTDVNTGEDLSDKSVMITIYSAGTTVHEIKDGAECEELAALPMIDFIVEPSGSSWVKSRKVTIIYPSVDGDYEASHRIDGGSWTRDSSADDGGNIEITFTEEAVLEARLKGDQIISGSISIVNIDNDKPVIKTISSSGSSGSNVIFTVVAYDETSGIDGIYISTSSSTPSEDASGWDSSMTSEGGVSVSMTITKGSGTYYIWVKDKAGNISDRKTVVISGATYHAATYYCPSGYTSSGSGSSMKCSKTVTTSATYHAATETCPTLSSGYLYDDAWDGAGTSCNLNWKCSLKPTTWDEKIGSTCKSNWVKVTGTVQYTCDGYTGSQPSYCTTRCQVLLFENLGGECENFEDDFSTTKEDYCAANPTGIVVFQPTAQCRYVESTVIQEAYYTCPDGYTPSRSSSSTKCSKTVTTSPSYRSAYYSCSSGTLVGSMCFKSS